MAYESPIKRLMIAVIQTQDEESAVDALTTAGVYVTKMSSTGAFLGRRNVTLLIGVGDNQEQAAIQALSKCCRRRIEYLATRLEGAPNYLPLSTPVTVGGATILTLEVERWEEIR
jgi:uncharacterized protein YaaQ